MSIFSKHWKKSKNICVIDHETYSQAYKYFTGLGDTIYMFGGIERSDRRLIKVYFEKEEDLVVFKLTYKTYPLET